ncbi:unnamed protein product [Rhodiola kirilowii]
MGEALAYSILSCNCSIYSNSGGDICGNRFELGLCGYYVPRSIKGHSYGITYKKSGKQNGDARFLGVTGGISMRRNIVHSVDNVVAGECRIEESLSSGSGSLTGEVCVDSHETGLPPWGNGEVGRGADLAPGSFEEVSKSSSKMVHVEDDEVLFLEERDERVLSVRLLSLSKCNKVKSAMGLFRSMKLSGLLPGVHASNSLLSCLLRNEMHDDALILFEFMKRNKLATGHSYSLMLKAVARSRGFEAAINMFWESERDRNVRKDFDIVVYNSIITACASVNNWIHAEKIWRNMKENGKNGNSITYCILVCTFVRCRQNDMAIDAYDEMVQKGLDPSKDAMQAVISACSKEGKLDLAHSVFQKMLDHELTPSLITCNILINMLGKSSTFSDAYEVYEIMRSLGHVPDAYTWKALLGSLYQAKRYADAVQFFENIRNENSPMLNVHLYNTTLMSCKKLRLWQKALQLLWRMEASGVPVDTMSYNIVINTCEVARKPKIALQVYEHMIQKNCHPDTFTYLSLIRGCIWGSLWDKVEEILTMVPPNSSLYNAAIQGMFLRGKLHAARKLYTEMLSYDLEPDGNLQRFGSSLPPVNYPLSPSRELYGSLEVTVIGADILAMLVVPRAKGDDRVSVMGPKEKRNLPCRNVSITPYRDAEMQTTMVRVVLVLTKVTATKFGAP